MSSGIQCGGAGVVPVPSISLSISAVAAVAVGFTVAAFLTETAVAVRVAAVMAVVAVGMVSGAVSIHPYHDLLCAVVIHAGGFCLGGNGNACHKGKQHHFEHILVHVRR